MIEHRGVVSLLRYFREQLALQPGHTVSGTLTQRKK